MGQKIISETLKDLGLTERDSEVFILLSKKGPIVARDMLRIVKISKAQLYRSIRCLQSKGMVESTLECPARFSAVSFDEILDLSVKSKRDEVQKIEEEREDALLQWKSLALDETPNLSDKFMVIEGEHHINSKVGQMIKDAKDEILLSTSALGIIRAEKANILKSIKESGVPFKIITNLCSSNLQIIEKTVGEARDAAGVCRHVDLAEQIFPRFVIRDSTELIFTIRPSEEPISNYKIVTGLWTNNKALIDAFKTFFGQLWNESVYVSQRASELRTGKAPPKTLVIRDAEVAYQKYLSLLGSAQKEIILVTSTKGLVSILDLVSVLDGWLKRSVNVRIMAPITKEDEDVVSKLSEYCTIRHCPSIYIKALIVDGKELLQFKALSPEKELSPSTNFDDSFYTDDPRYVEGRREALIGLWNNASSAR